MKKHHLFILLSLLIALPGCATYKKKFKRKTVANIGFFADSTITMLGGLTYTLDREDTLLARRFFDVDAPEEQLVIQFDQDLRKTLRNIVRYSIDLVNIAEIDGEDDVRIKAYGRYITQFRDVMIDNELIDSKGFDSTIAEVRQQTEFIQALKKAQPLLNAAAMSAALGVEDYIHAVEALADKMDARIDEDYADIIRYRIKLEREKFDVISAFEIIYDAYRMEEPNLDELRTSGVIWTPEIIPEGRPTRDNLKDIGEHLHNRLQSLDVVQKEMEPNWQDYLSTHKELDKHIDLSIKNAHQARIVILTWSRANQKMASGRVDPAQWFDIGEVTKSLVKTAPKAVL